MAEVYVTFTGKLPGRSKDMRVDVKLPLENDFKSVPFVKVSHLTFHVILQQGQYLYWCMWGEEGLQDTDCGLGLSLPTYSHMLTKHFFS